MLLINFIKYIGWIHLPLNKVSIFVVSYRYDMIWQICLVNDTTWHNSIRQFFLKYFNFSLEFFLKIIQQNFSMEFFSEFFWNFFGIFSEFFLEFLRNFFGFFFKWDNFHWFSNIVIIEIYGLPFKTRLVNSGSRVLSKKDKTKWVSKKSWNNGRRIWRNLPWVSDFTSKSEIMHSTWNASRFFWFKVQFGHH